MTVTPQRRDTTQSARYETGIADLPRTCPWDHELVLTPDWLPPASP